MSLRTFHSPPARRPRAVVQVAAVLVSAATGWLAHGAAVPTPAPAPAAVQATAPAVAKVAGLAYATPFIAVSSDGNVTLRVEQQPLDWVLEQIAVQGGWPDLGRRSCPAAERAAAGASAAPVPASCPESATPPVDAARVLQAIESGSEAECFQGLMLARSADIVVAEATLKSLYETGPSERVQVAAFEAYLALRADQPEALRAALEAAQYVPTAAIQREAGQRLAELRENQRLDALPPLADP